MDPQKCLAIRKWPTPMNVVEFQSFLGLANFYRRFVKSFSSIASPLYELTAKNIPFIWKHTHQACFDKLKSALVEDVLLVHPHLNESFILRTDAVLLKNTMVPCYQLPMCDMT
jgi:hypothetical protein